MEIVVDEMIGPIVAEVAKILLALIGIVIPASGAMLIRWINRKTKNDTLVEYMGILTTLAQKAVMSVAQTEAKLFREAAEDGKLSEEEKEKLKTAAINRLKAIAPDSILAFMKRAKSDTDKLLDIIIESTVYENKSGG